MSVYTIPASSGPWSDTSAAANKVHYAGVENNGANYSWYTATAGTQGSSYSICPRKWRLPSETEYRTLLSSAGIANSSAGSAKIRGKPYNFSYAGIVGDGSLSRVGSQGYYWSSTANGTDTAYHLGFVSSYVGTDRNYRYVGLPIRCIAP